MYTKNLFIARAPYHPPVVTACNYTPKSFRLFSDPRNFQNHPGDPLVLLRFSVTMDTSLGLKPVGFSGRFVLTAYPDL